MAEETNRGEPDITVVRSSTEEDESELSSVEVKVKSKGGKKKKKVNSERRYVLLVAGLSSTHFCAYHRINAQECKITAC